MRALLLGATLLVCSSSPPASVDVRPGCRADLISTTIYHDGAVTCYRTTSACGTAAGPARDGAWYWSVRPDGSAVPLVSRCTPGTTEYPHGVLQEERSEGSCRAQCGTACGPDRIWYASGQCVRDCRATGRVRKTCE